MWLQPDESFAGWRAQHPQRSAAHISMATESADVLSDLLRALRLSGALMFRGDLSAPWAVETPESAQLASMLSPGAKRLVLFHVVAEGHCWLDLADGPRVRLEREDVVVFPYGDRHTMSSDGAPEPQPVAALLQTAQRSEGLSIVVHGDGGGLTRLVCGYVQCDELMFNPLLKSLPPLLHAPAAAERQPPHVPATERGTSLLTTTVRQLIAAAQGSQAGGACLRSRLAELLFIEVLRRHITSLPAQTIGWMGALNDPMVGRALQLLHARPAERWTVDGLAREVGTSRSLLGTRFKKLLGQPPMRYLACWRLQLAARLLREGVPGMAAVAAPVGYESEAAFNRAFKRHNGEPPATWRDKAARNRMPRLSSAATSC